MFCFECREIVPFRFDLAVSEVDMPFGNEMYGCALPSGTMAPTGTTLINALREAFPEESPARPIAVPMPGQSSDWYPSALISHQKKAGS
jgi:hypothetical protein